MEKWYEITRDNNDVTDIKEYNYFDNNLILLCFLISLIFSIIIALVTMYSIWKIMPYF